MPMKNISGLQIARAEKLIQNYVFGFCVAIFILASV